MKTELHLDYKTVLANQAMPIHFAVRFTAPNVSATRPKPAAFCVVLDRSGSMEGTPLDQAKKATALAVRNLRREDQFGLVIFDDQAQTVIPLQPIQNRQQLLQLIDRIHTAGSTNLTGGWMLGRDELKKATAGVTRRLLLLSDGQLNQGIVEPLAVRQIVGNGLEQDGIRTSCLGFGERYNEDLMAELSKVANGQFYDAQSAEQLPAIFASELEGLQKLAVQNLRLRLKQLDFCESIGVLGLYPTIQLPDKRYELSIGDLVSDEERVVCFALEVLALPWVDGQPVASLQGEKLLEIEVQYDEIKENSVTSRTETQTVRIQATTNPDEIKVNEEVVSWVALQQAGRTADDVTKKVDQGDLDGAQKIVRETISRLGKYGSKSAVGDAVRLLEDLSRRLEVREDAGMSRKMARYYSSSLGKMSSKEMWTGKSAAPGFKQAVVPPSPAGKGQATETIPDDLIAALQDARSVVVMTGAGISQESGIPTFRDAMSGMWAKFDPTELATPEAFARDPERVTRWYDERRVRCAQVQPNAGHDALAELESWLNARGCGYALVTQTVDGLHKRAGSREIWQLHGSLWIWRCAACGEEKEERGPAFAEYPPKCSCGGIRRPAIVWFGEALSQPDWDYAMKATGGCEVFMSVGTSSQVYPAAGLAELAQNRRAKIVEVNPAPTGLTPRATWVLTGKAGEVLPKLVESVCRDAY